MATYCVIVERVIEVTWKIDVDATDNEDAQAQVQQLIADAGGQPEDCDQLELLGNWAQKNQVHIGSGVRS